MFFGIAKFFRTCLYRIVVIFPTNIRHRIVLRRIRERGYAKVLFLASNLSMWKYEKLVDKLILDERFKVSIILVPFLRYGKDEARRCMLQLKEYFDAKGLVYLDSQSAEHKRVDLMKMLDPDIVFYQQPYAQMLDNRYDSSSNHDRLICYYPYGLSTFDSDWQYRLKFNNVAWKLYYSTEGQKEDAKRRTYNSGRNMVVVGYPDYDLFLSPATNNPWKSQIIVKKKIIWAPHFSISPGLRLHRDSFLWMADIMIDISAIYKDSVQFAFKPHPHLLQELYNHPDWGKDKADAYYDLWRDMENGQLVESDYIDLFKTSDALIHDCGDFTAEYLYTKKPVMFVSHHLDNEMNGLNRMGKDAIDAHYIGTNFNDVASFVESVIAGEADPKHDKRISFYDTYFNQPIGETVTERTYSDISSSIWGQ